MGRRVGEGLARKPASDHRRRSQPGAATTRTPPPGPDAPDAPPAPAAAAAAFVCDCSCAGPAALEAAALEIARLGPAGAAQAGALAQCAMTCAARWAGCEE